MKDYFNTIRVPHGWSLVQRREMSRIYANAAQDMVVYVTLLEENTHGWLDIIICRSDRQPDILDKTFVADHFGGRIINWYQRDATLDDGEFPHVVNIRACIAPGASDRPRIPDGKIITGYVEGGLLN